MIQRIDGSTGPYPLSWLKPGNYGRNAAENYYVMEDRLKGATDLYTVLSSTLRYTPEGTLGKAAFYRNLSGFTEIVMKKDDQDGDGGLNLQELEGRNRRLVQKQFGFFTPLIHLLANALGDRRWWRNTFKAMDRNQDGKIDRVELAADMIFSDNSSNLLAHKLLSQTGLNGRRKTQVEKIASRLREKYPAEFDGQITWAESRANSWGYQKYPGQMGEILDDIIREHDLYQRLASR